MEHHRRGRHHRQGHAQNDEVQRAYRRVQDLSVGAAGQQMDSHAHALHLEVRAHRGLVPQHLLEPYGQGRGDNLRLRVLRRKDRIRAYRRLLLRVPHGRERAAHEGEQDRRCGHNEGGPSGIHHARGSVERQGERAHGAVHQAVPLREPGPGPGACGEGHGHQARHLDRQLRRHEGLDGPTEDR